MGLIDGAARERLRDWLLKRCGAESVDIVDIRRLSGGAIQDNHGLTLDVSGGRFQGRQGLALRTDAPSGVAVSLSRSEEFRILETVWRAGVKVPEPLWLCVDKGVIGAEFYITRLVSGSAAPRDLVRGFLTDEQREALVESLGAELAGIHRVRPPEAGLEFLELPSPTAPLARVAEYRRHLNALPGSWPVTEWALSWLESNAPSGGALTLCHSDYRTGNYLVSRGCLTAVLDWEFAAWGDPLEDIGWFCARCWRFGAWDREAGGVGDRVAFYRGYESITETALDRFAVSYWEVMAAVRWAVIALQQSQRHLSGEQRSLELALTGRKIPEMEMDMLMEIERIEMGAYAYV